MSNIKTNFSHIQIAKKLDELLVLDDQEFLYCAYRTLLNRSPDEIGMEYYLDRLHEGEKKIQILMELRASGEGRRLNPAIIGLDASIQRHKFLRRFDIGRIWPKKVNHKPVRDLSSSADTLQQFNLNDIDSTILTPPSRVIRNPIPFKSMYLSPTLPNSQSSKRRIWVDITLSMDSNDDQVRSCREELEIACGFNQLDNEIGYCMRVDNSYVEIDKIQLLWLLDSKNITQAHTAYRGLDKNVLAAEVRDNRLPGTTYKITVNVPDSGELYFPFQENDVLICVSKSVTSNLGIVSKIKSKLPKLHIGLMVYESHTLNSETAFYYSLKERAEFHSYAKLISNISDFIIYGGSNIQCDFLEIQRKMGWKSPPSNIIKPGLAVNHELYKIHLNTTLKKFQLEDPYVLALGDFESRDNFDTAYKAFRMGHNSKMTCFPKLVLYGKLGDSAKDLLDSLIRDPIIKDKIIILSETEFELSSLIENCLFIIAPSVFENSISALQNSLFSNKLCLIAETPLARESGGEFACYLPPLDVKAWVTKIDYFSKNARVLQQFEGKIKSNWTRFSWLESSAELYKTVGQLTQSKITEISVPDIWLDISTSYLYWEGGVAGIIRAELTFAKYLFELAPNTNKVHFFAWSNNHFFEIVPERLQWLFDSEDLVRDYKWFQEFWKNHTVKRDPFADSPPTKNDPRAVYAFPDNSIVMFTCIDWNMYQSRVKAAVEMRDKGEKILLSQLIYDMTPFLVPHLHAEATCAGFIPFVEYVSNNFDHLIYGGKTAMRDTIQIQRDNKWLSPISDYIEFGSDIQFDKGLNVDSAVLDKFGIASEFILTVGTIEPRKNHEMLYKAYLMMIAKDLGHEMPTLIIVGKRGWKFDDFLNAFNIDERIKGKIIIISPSDMELDVLYRKCLFTVLPSFYEGWSLTLPESLGYGKYCLTSKVDPLMETGRDLVEYIDPLDTAEWAARIHFYATNTAILRERELQIAKNWKPKSWKESTQSLWNLSMAAHRKVTTKSGNEA